MSTIPSISEAGGYTVVGGETLDREGKDRPGLSIVLLNRGPRQFRRDLFEELCKLGAREVISIESAPCPYDVESLVKRHPKLRFLIFTGEPNSGGRIDAAMREALSEHIFVIRGDMQIKAATISSRVFSKISERGRLCTVPFFRDEDGEVLPTAIGPVAPGRGGFDTQPRQPGDGETSTLLPWDYCGIYHKEKHRAIGGFDETIREPWWQKLDYGMRAWLWGEEIRVNSSLKISYLGHIPAEDISPGEGYRRFFLRNLAVKRRGDMAVLPASRWWSYRRYSGESSRSSRDDWKEIREWVRKHRYRFTRDASELIELWDWSE